MTRHRLLMITVLLSVSLLFSTFITVELHSPNACTLVPDHMSVYFRGKPCLYDMKPSSSWTWLAFICHLFYIRKRPSSSINCVPELSNCDLLGFHRWTLLTAKSPSEGTGWDDNMLLTQRSTVNTNQITRKAGVLLFLVRKYWRWPTLYQLETT